MGNGNYDYEDIARVCHEANRQLQILNEEDVNPSWEALEEELRASAIDGVEKKIRYGLTPQQSHENWLAFKEEQGWVYGSVKDFEKKEHPCMVPYDELPPEQRIKDHLFTAIVEVLS